jgi:hypothetical protein
VLRQPTSTFEVSFGTNDYNLNEQSRKLTKKVSLARMPAEVVMILMCMPMEERVPTFVEKNQL